MKRVLTLVSTGMLVFGTCMAVSAAPESLSSSSSSSVSENAVSREVITASDREAEAEALAIKATGIPQEAWFGAEEEGKSIGEYMSNSVLEVPGLDSVTPVGQGGNVIIDGKASNVTLSVQKPLLFHVNSAKTQAEAVSGKVLNVVDIKTTVSFENATVNFYMPGVTADTKVQVYQYADKQWTSVGVAEVREDHVVVDMTRPGVLAFFEVQ